MHPFSFYETPLVVLVIYVFVTIGKRLNSTLRLLKNAQTTCVSSVQQHLSSLEAPDGIATVRSNCRKGYFTASMHQILDERFSAYWHYTLCGVMIEFQLGALGALYITLSCLFIVLTGADAGTAGVALSFAARFSDTASKTLKRMAAVETNLDSVQRIADYENIAQESMEGEDIPADWPSKGEIQVQKLVAGCHESLPATLQDISFTVCPGERIGVVGRTGAGKSTLALAFARLIQQRSGSIHIDGVDIASIRLDALRKRLLIIPQDPHISAGSLRSMLDPEGTCTDETLIACLTKFRFLSISQENCHPPKLDLSFRIQDGGSNLSPGQRQILHLAHAALSNYRVIIMDEVTSAVDMETDAAIQAAIRHRGPDESETLREATMIVVAHRMATVADMDKVLVLVDGRVAEFGAPGELFRSRGPFWKLVMHSDDSHELLKKKGW